MPGLIKSAFLLTRRSRFDHPDRILFLPDPEAESHCGLQLDAIVWEDMGQPDEITVTVEPGDTLNEEEPSPFDGAQYE